MASCGNYLHTTMQTTHSQATGKPGRIDWDRELARHSRWLRVVVLTRSGDPQAVDEIVQDIAVSAIQQSAPIQNPEQIAPWLYRVAVRHSLLHRRRLGRRRRLYQRYADRNVQPDVQENDPLAWLIADELRDNLRHALNKLNPRDAEILMLKYTENWNYGQIDDHLGISHSAVESRLHRARQRLRSELSIVTSIEVTT